MALLGISLDPGISLVTLGISLGGLFPNGEYQFDVLTLVSYGTYEVSYGTYEGRDGTRISRSSTRQRPADL